MNARDRIETGPWVNAAGVVIAKDVAALHGDANAISKETALDETGGGGERARRRAEPARHPDRLSCPTAPPPPSRPARTGTSGGADTAGMVGHHDRMGLDDSDAAKSWNSSHASRGGCGLEALRGTGGDGLIYCFAVE